MIKTTATITATTTSTTTTTSITTKANNSKKNELRLDSIGTETWKVRTLSHKAALALIVKEPGREAV